MIEGSTQASEKFTVFIYGTLLKGQLRESVLASENFIGPVQTAPMYKMYHIDLGGECGYPALIESPEDGYSATGELYEISWNKLRELDQIEGEPWLYNRKPIQLQESEEQQVISYIYQKDISGRTEISGCWRTFVQETYPGIEFQDEF
mmetsp:Transcript_34115/g.43038  ORF Transcript_34115/g.43038 Transcript_34115/m.43038 type:complete len:148 (+) Transcript_34115:41-484(+)